MDPTHQPPVIGAPRIGVVVLNWNGATDTLACLDSLRDATPRPARVLVVDNGSADDSCARIGGWAAARGEALRDVRAEEADPAGEGAAPRPAEPAPWLTLLRSGENRGFAGGNNVGVRAIMAGGDLTHVLLLNNDATVAPDYFAALAAALRAAPEAAVLSGTIYEMDRPERVWYAGGRSAPLRGMVSHLVSRPADDAPRPTEFVTGCTMLISRDALARLGALPECYFPAYGEDAEYSHRARRLGLAVVYAPAPTAYHKSATSARRPDSGVSIAYLDVRHRAFYVRRNLRGWQRGVALLYLVVTKPARAATFLARGRATAARATLRGLAHGLLSSAARR